MDWASVRREMVETQLIPRGITDEGVLQAMADVPRHLFVSPGLESRAYGDHALPIQNGQTISQPYMVALMTQELQLSGSEKVLEIGTGSGYQTAILSRLADRVFSIERVEPLARRAMEVIEGLGIHNVAIRIGDGTIGWQEFEPFDRILVTAGAPRVPQSLLDQLADPGILVAPVGSQGLQQLKIVTKENGELSVHRGGECVFVPLLGREGWDDGRGGSER
jgi:protein-L-isoaspartate(D-aspartate) O-methyltransferase